MVESKARWKRLIAFMLAFAMVFSSIAVSSFSTVTVQAASRNVKKVTLKVTAKDVTKKSINVYSGSKKTLKVFVSPKSSKKSVTFKSSKPSVASVTKKGVITGKKKGTAKINVTVTGKDNKKTKTYVNVKVKYVKLSLNKKNASVNAGKSITLKATSTPKKTVKWSSSNKAVATVSSKGVVKGVKAGTATITAAVGQKKATCKVTVKGKAEVAVTGVKASIESSEISVGNGTQIVASVLPENATNKTLTYSSSDESVATVNEAGVVLGTGAGTATITVRSANGKTASVQVTVAYVNVTGITVSPNELSLGVSAAEDLTAVIEPANASAKLVKWSSDNEAVATVDENGKVTGVAVGTARITAAATDESGVSGTCVVNVKDADGVTMELANPYTENGKSIPNTVLYGNDMDIRVQARKGNQPLANAKVTLKMQKVTDENSSARNARYEIKEDYATTDSDGYVDFVIGLKQDQAHTKAFDGTGLAEVYNVTASEVSSGKKAELIVNTATLEIGGIQVVRPNAANGLKLDPSSNWDSNNGEAVHTTASLDAKKTQEYVVSQKASPAGTDSNRVEFSTSLGMRYGQNAKAEQGDWTPAISGTGASDTYTVYNDLSNEKTTTQILSVPSGLKYITLKFKEISLSDYTKVLVGLYGVDEQGNLNPRPLYNKSKEITRANNTTSVYSVQIDTDTADIQNAAECRLVISVVTEGQVSQTEKGYQLDSVVGQWGTEKTAAVKWNPLPEGTVNWSVVSEEVSNEQSNLDPVEAKNIYRVPVGAGYADYKYTYSVPVFPYTGDAFITVTDKNNSIIGIYAYPTENVGNKNVLAENWNGIPVYVSQDEAANIANATLTTSGNNAIVNTEATGRTNLKATININGLSEEEFNKQNGKELYTSVQWAPVISSTPSEVTGNDDYYALEGQVVTVTAQLLDVNGNRVARDGQAINFTQGSGNVAISGLTTGTVIASNGNKKVVLASDVTKTDSNGQVRMVLLGDGMSYIENLKANCADYRVQLDIQNGNEKISINNGADIYWVDLGVKFTDSAIDAKRNTTEQYENYVKDTVEASESEIMQDWYIGYLPVADVANGSITDFEPVNIPIDYTVSSNTVSINSAANKIESFKITDQNKGQYLTNTSNNVASIHSNRNIDMYLTGKINASTIASAGNVSFTFKTTKNGKEVEETRPNVGSGISNVISETGLKHTIKWQSSGMKAAIEPASSLVNTGVSTNVVFKVGDNYGNVLKDTTLQYKIVMPNGDSLAGDVTTAENGSCSVTIPAANATAAGACFINVSGVVGNANITASHTITYREAAAGMIDEQADIDEVIVDESPNAGIADEQPNADAIAN